MLNAETAQVLIALITTGGTVVVAWLNYRSTRPPDPPKREPRAKRGSKSVTKGS